MKMPVISLLEWQKKYGTEKACIKTLTKFVGRKAFSVHRVGRLSSVLFRQGSFINVLIVDTRYR
jgi:hypothetical protein